MKSTNQTEAALLESAGAEAQKSKFQPIAAVDIAPVPVPSRYPAPFNARMAGRTRRALGDHFSLANFGVNLTVLAPGASSALRHAHTRQDEFVYVLEGAPTVHTDDGVVKMTAGMCIGFRSGTGNAHRLLNDTDGDVVYLEVGDRTVGDEVVYPDDDLAAVLGANGLQFTHRDGRPYDQPALLTPVNAFCPRSGKPVSDDSLTSYLGYTVGFCNPGCRDDFAAHTTERPHDCAYFDAAIDSMEGRDEAG